MHDSDLVRQVARNQDAVPAIAMTTIPAADTHESAPLRVSDVGEFGLIERLAKIVEQSIPPRTDDSGRNEIGIGDDAAVWTPRADRSEILTTDALIENVHFRTSTTSWRDLGWKALAENVSDIAAMGGIPTRAFVTLGLRGNTLVADVEDLYRGMQELALAYGLRIVGGDTVSSPLTVISISVLGEMEGHGLRRAAGNAGDLLAVTGALGASLGGLELMEAPRSSNDPLDAALVRAHRRPIPRVVEAGVLVSAGIRCGMDLSDGLRGDAGKLAKASGLAADIHWEQIPVHAALENRFGARARGMALVGGEDYELLVAAPAHVIKRAAVALADAGLVTLTVVGRLSASPRADVRVLDETGAEISTTLESWDHFAHGADQVE